MKPGWMPNNKKPRIGVTGPDKGGNAAWIFTGLSIFLAGGIPVRVRPSNPKSIDKLQGLVIGGGADIDPEAYENENFFDSYLKETLQNKKRSFKSRIKSFIKFLIYPIIFLIRKILSRKGKFLDKERDVLEFSLVNQAVVKELPLLGICRGAQLLNVYFKGDLYDDISSFYQEESIRESIFPVKKVFLKSRSKLARLIGVDELYVNALHHQAVKQVGEGIEVVAEEPNGVVQAIESSQHNFIIGVQWHPEYLITKSIHRKIFRGLIQNAKTPGALATFASAPNN